MGFRLVPKSVTLNDLEQRTDRYFALFYRIRQLRGQLRRSGCKIIDLYAVSDKNVVQ